VVAAHRRRVSTVRKKSDRTDAEIIALALRDGWPRMSPQPTNSAEAVAVTVLVDALDRTQATRRRLQGQLRSLLRHAHPAAVTAWAHLDGGLRRPEARKVLAAAPTAATAARPRRPAIAALLRDAGRTRLVDAEAGRLRDRFTAPVLRLPSGVEHVMEHNVRAVLGLFDAACTTEDTLTAELDSALQQHPHGKILLSFPGLGPLGAARILAHLGDDPTRFATIRGLRAYAGLAPLTWASGNSRTVNHRRICNRGLKATCHQWAFSSLTRSPGCRALYDQRRTAGDTYAGSHPASSAASTTASAPASCTARTFSSAPTMKPPGGGMAQPRDTCGSSRALRSSDAGTVPEYCQAAAR
jgi:transposase